MKKQDIPLKERISSLRDTLRQRSIGAFILPVNDEFMGEYVPTASRRLEWLTGFSGSAGMVAVTADKTAFFTDGRYMLQARAQVQGAEIINTSTLKLTAWLSQQKVHQVGFDPRLHTVDMLREWKRQVPEIEWSALEENPIDSLWQSRPAFPDSGVELYPEQYAGETYQKKSNRMIEKLRSLGVDWHYITAPDSVCWLLNIRGNDVPHVPLILVHAALSCEGEIVLFIEPGRLSEEVPQHLQGVEFIAPEKQASTMQRFKGKSVLVDDKQTSVWIADQLEYAGAKLVYQSDPCQYAKACKNAVEIEGIRAAHRRDGLALTRFLYWLEMAHARGEQLDELGVAAKLESLRALAPEYRGPSFPTICGSGPNGAIVHYRADETSNRVLDKNSLLLIDSGGQYLDGTTDVTRTVALGNSGPQMKEHFTRVLKGHIALATALFPEGTAGAQLDALARQYLWQVGLDYDHGTGHGVGCYLSVHEGPQRISKRGGDIALAPGMILSNEPGFYQDGEYGIRIENLVVVVEKEIQGNKRFLGLETLTLAPIDTRLIEPALMTASEWQWLRDYHARVYEAHAPLLDDKERAWLENKITDSL